MHSGQLRFPKEKDSGRWGIIADANLQIADLLRSLAICGPPWPSRETGSELGFWLDAQIPPSEPRHE
jgi:hypothetical protein